MNFKSSNRDKFFIEICLLNNKIEYSFSDIERALGFKKAKIDLRKLLKFLVEKNMLEHKKTIQGVNYYRINKNKMRDFYDEQEVRLYQDKFSKEFHIFSY